MASACKPGDVRDPAVEGLFDVTAADPETLFVDLQHVGDRIRARDVRTNETVTVKKIPLQPSAWDADDKWEEIVNEVRILKSLEHGSCVAFKGAYVTDKLVWVVTEFCFASVEDVLLLHKSPLKEPEIAAVCRLALPGLVHLHSQNRIHRDIKAGNILLTETGTVKLGGFDCASPSSPADDMKGTPYWMAPEVVAAFMDKTSYDTLADVWSLGITCVEMAELDPPLISEEPLNAMRLVHARPSPSLQAGGSSWSQEFRDFVDACLRKDAGSRPSAQPLLEHPFMKKHKT